MELRVSDMEGKVARVATSELGSERVSLELMASVAISGIGAILSDV
jgi:hypothetical protein